MAESEVQLVTTHLDEVDRVIDGGHVTDNAGCLSRQLQRLLGCCLCIVSSALGNTSGIDALLGSTSGGRGSLTGGSGLLGGRIGLLQGRCNCRAGRAGKGEQRCRVRQATTTRACCCLQPLPLSYLVT